MFIDIIFFCLLCKYMIIFSRGKLFTVSFEQKRIKHTIRAKSKYKIECVPLYFQMVEFGKVCREFQIVDLPQNLQFF